MSRILITGMGGFMGSHLAEFLRAREHAVAGTVHRDRSRVGQVRDAVTALSCDLQDGEQVESAVRAARPDVIFHLAAQSLPLLSWQDPVATFRVNVLGTVHLLEAVRKADLDPTIVIAGSSAEYAAERPAGAQIGEEVAIRPSSPYGASKAAADLLAVFYRDAFQMNVLRIRPFLAIGPRKTGDVCSDFARGIVAVERGLRGTLRVGNLDAVRDFMDVRDAVRACWLIAEKGLAAEPYNVCSGEGHSVQEVLDILLSKAACAVPLEPDPRRLRPNEPASVIGDNSRLRALGWAPTIPLERSLTKILGYWRGMKEAYPDGERASDTGSCAAVMAGESGR